MEKYINALYTCLSLQIDVGGGAGSRNSNLPSFSCILHAQQGPSSSLLPKLNIGKVSRPYIFGRLLDRHFIFGELQSLSYRIFSNPCT